MGNAQMKLRDSNEEMLITKSLLENFQKHVTIVDHAVTGLVSGIDALQSTCQLFFQQKEKPTVQEHTETTVSDGTEILILQKIDECISDNRHITLESLRNLFSFIRDIGKTYIVNADVAFASLSVNRYNEWRSEDKTHHDWFTEFYKRRLEDLKTEVELLHKTNAFQKKEIEFLKKQRVLSPFKDLLTTPVKDWCEPNNVLEERRSDCKIECTNEAHLKSEVEQFHYNVKQIQDYNLIPILRQDADDEDYQCSQRVSHRKESVAITTGTLQEPTPDDLRKGDKFLENEHAKKETDPLTKEKTANQKKKLSVQIFRREDSMFPSTYDAEEAFMLRLNSEVRRRNVELEVERCRRSEKMKDNLPVLITVSHLLFKTKHSTIETAIKVLDVSKNMAVLVFHSKEERDMYQELKEYDKETPYVGDVFHIGYNGKSLHNSEINKENIEKIIDFIESFGELGKGYSET